MTDRQKTKYQHGDSDTALKIAEAGFPNDMTDKSFLDLGANAGAFVNMAIDRGSNCAVGIEANKTWVDAAKKENNVTIHHQNWNDPWPLDNSTMKWDTIIWFSASHYEPRPRRILNRIYDSLSYTGVFIWETGVAEGSEKSFSLLPRPDHQDRYPTIPMAESLLSRFSFRLHGPSTSLKNQGERRFYHCWKKKPKVVLIKGNSRAGKTEMSRQFKDAVILEFDLYSVELERSAKFGGKSKFFQAVKEYDAPIISTQERFERYLRERGLIDELVKSFCYPITPDEPFFILEGGILGLIKEEIFDYLSPGKEVWDMTHL